MMLEIKNYSKSFKDIVLLDDVSMEFFLGNIYYIKAPNGYGKSTLLSSLYKRESYKGDILIDGINLKEISKENLRSNYISFISQKTVLDYDLSLIDNLDSIKCDYSKEKLNFFIGLFDLNNKKDKKLKKLSGGEKQKIFIMINLLKDTPIIILDEPFNNLDKDTYDKFLDYLFSLKDKIVFLTSHIDIEGNVINISIEDDKLVKLNKESENKSLEKLIPANNKYKIDFVKEIKKNASKNFLVVTFLVLVSLLFFYLTSNSLIDQQKENAMNQSFSSSSITISSLFKDVDEEEKESKTYQESLLKHKYVFSDNDLELLKGIEGVSKIYPYIASGGTENLSSLDDRKIDGSYNISNLDTSKYLSKNQNINNVNNATDEVSVEFSQLMYPVDYINDFPSAFSLGQLIYGNYPIKNNEILIDENLALIVMKKLNIDNIEDVINKEVKIPTKELICFNNCDIEERSYKITGIYNNFKLSEASYVVMAHDGKTNIQRRSLNNEDYEYYYSELEIVADEELIDVPNYETFKGNLDKEGGDINGITILVDEDKYDSVLNKVQELFPSNLVNGYKISDYKLELFSKKEILVLIVIFILSLIFLNKYFKTLKTNILVTDFYGGSIKDKLKIILSNYIKITISYNVLIIIIFINKITFILMPLVVMNILILLIFVINYFIVRVND